MSFTWVYIFFLIILTLRRVWITIKSYHSHIFGFLGEFQQPLNFINIASMPKGIRFYYLQLDFPVLCCVVQDDTTQNRKHFFNFFILKKLFFCFLNGTFNNYIWYFWIFLSYWYNTMHLDSVVFTIAEVKLNT